MCRLLLLIIFAGTMVCGAALSQPAEPSGEDLRSLAELLRKPAIQDWLKAQAEGKAARPADTAAAGPAASTQQMMAGRLDATRAFLRELAAAVPTLPAELGRARAMLMAELSERGPFPIVVPLGFFAALGFGLEWLFWWATTGFRSRMIATGLETVEGRLRAVGLRILYGLGVVAAFAVGSIGAFLAFDWPPLLQQIVLAYLMVFLIVRLVLVAGRIVLAPGAERFRLVPMATATARFWFVWSAVLVGWFCFVQFTFDLLPVLGVGLAARFIVGLAGGLVLLGLTLFTLWRCPSFDGLDRTSRRHRVGAWLLSLYLVAVWLSAFSGATEAFYIGVILLILPITIRGARMAVAHVLRPPGSEAAHEAVPSLTAVALDRGLRAALLIGGAWLIAWVLGLDLATMTARDTLATRLLRGAVNAAVIVLLADFAWHLARALIDRTLVEASAGTQTEGDEARRRARLRTLLPILRNVLFVVLVVMAALMGLAALGVEIGPLVAGAGVVGVAVGFGAQTIVKDIISGMFYLLDDAFRVGEYIESGSYMGTVESFSLRSVKLRHHRGPVFTIPFSELGAVQNHSRDWVIEKIRIGITYDSDIEKARKLIKQVGLELAADPEFGPLIIKPPKMQGVEKFGDFAIQIAFNMTTKPGEQYPIKRRALVMIKKAFDENGIKFAFPTVTVAGGGDAPAAVAQKGLELARPPAPAT